MDLSKIITAFNQNEYITFGIACTGILSFIMSLYVTWRTTSISKELRKIKIAKDYNKNRKGFIERLDGHKHTIEDGNESKSLALAILEDYKKLDRYYSKDIFDFIDRAKLKHTIYKLKKKKIDYNKITYSLIHFIARLNIPA